MKTPKDLLEEKITELENIKKRCQDQDYLPGRGMLANYALRDFIEWNLKDLKFILKKLDK